MYYTLLVSEEPLDWQLAHTTFPSIAGCFNTTADGLLMEAVRHVAADKLEESVLSILDNNNDPKYHAIVSTKSSAVNEI